ncbi:MAG TPA: DUF6526 family protein [Chitinophagaceae bacterium]|nr:DUF6526 family protein [Chitinophagaceae bacterium]
MNEQNFKNHVRYLRIWHFLLPSLVMVVLVGSICNLVNSLHGKWFPATWPVITSIVLLGILWYSRAFALKAQDRAIRAEENFRYFILTGKPLDKQLRLGQIIALRFASDEEMAALAKRALDEKLSSRQIKEAIKNWKADFDRA